MATRKQNTNQKKFPDRKKKRSSKGSTPKKKKELDKVFIKVVQQSRKDNITVRRSKRNEGKVVSYNIAKKMKRQGSLERKVGWDQVTTADALLPSLITEYITSPKLKKKYKSSFTTISATTSTQPMDQASKVLSPTDGDNDISPPSSFSITDGKNITAASGNIRPRSPNSASNSQCPKKTKSDQSSSPSATNAIEIDDNNEATTTTVQTPPPLLLRMVIMIYRLHHPVASLMEKI